jgi:beta-galactosidase
VADAEGLIVPRSHHLVQFGVAGPGEIVAVGNGDAASHEPFQARQRSAYNGLCQVIVRARSDPDQNGPITLTAQSAGLKEGTVSIRTTR